MNGNGLYSILKQETEKNKSFIRLRTSGGIKTNDLINSIIHSGNIISFNPALPSMNDIFIRVVEAKN
jgi:ABC-type uncharacterized transport system ATPase subunit